MNIRNSASVQLQGQLKAGDLADFLAEVPKDATVALTETRGDQRDPGYFTLTATWAGAKR
ncbi:hypothetical protein ACLRGI_04975 [Paenarthrobacter nitroguajacolicus]|uniref:hypothetical protein n=1 Tax=Paenarthrobacter nitroguajacolicus TaxID=211146 RepID=UPI003AE1F0BE